MSKRITLCTVTADGKCYNSFNEGYYDYVGGLREAMKDAEETSKAWKGHHYECEKGVGVAVFSLLPGVTGADSTETKVLAWWPFR